MKTCKRTLFILLAFVTSTLWAGQGSNLFAGLEKLAHNWHKITHHKSKFMLVKDCDAKEESLNIFVHENKYYLSHETYQLKTVHEILSCKDNSDKKHHMLELELKDLKSNNSRTAQVKVGKHKSIWYGLTSNTSTDVFIIDENKKDYDPLHPDCN